MITVTYTCDRCKNTFPKSEDLNQLKVFFTNPQHRDYSYQCLRQLPTEIPTVDWCEECLKASGVVKVQREPDVAPPTMEEFLRTLIQEIVDDTVQRQ